MRRYTQKSNNSNNNRRRHNNSGGGGNDRRQKFNAQKNNEKYLNMAKDAAQNGDLVQAENWYQHADHYFRVMSSFEDDKPTPKHNDNVENSKQQSSSDNQQPSVDTWDEQEEGKIANQQPSDDAVKTSPTKKRVRRTKAPQKSDDTAAKQETQQDASAQPDIAQDGLDAAFLFQNPLPEGEPSAETVTTTEEKPKKRRGRPAKKIEAASSTSEE